MRNELNGNAERGRLSFVQENSKLKIQNSKLGEAVDSELGKAGDSEQSS